MNAKAPSISAEIPGGAAAWYALAVLIATTVFAFVDRQIINLIAPTLQRDLSISDLELGLIQGLGLALFASAAGYPIGWLSDRFGRRLVLGGCIILWALSTAACAFQNGFAGVFAATSGIAIGEAALTPVIFSMMPDLFPERQRNTANIVFFAAVMLGASAGLGLGGLVLDWLARHQQDLPGALATMAGWRVALIIVAVPAPLFVLLLWTLRTRGIAGHIAPSHAARTLARLEQFLPFVRAHWRMFGCIYGAVAAYSLTTTSAFAWLPVAMLRIFGTKPATVGVQLGAAVGIGTVVGLALPLLGSRLLRGDVTLKPLHMARIFLAAACLPTAFLLIAWRPWHVFAAFGVQLALMLGTAALVPGLLQQISPPGLRSRILSIFGIVSAVASGVAPLTVGALSGLLRQPDGILIAIVIVSLPGWAIGSLLMSLAQRPFIVTAAAVKGEEQTP